MQFNQIIGQEPVKRLLKDMVQSGRMPHAQLLLGPEGCGKLALALAFAQAAMCENPQAGDACGACSQCSKASKLIHPDIHFTFPTVGTNALSSHFLEDWRTMLAEHPYFNANQWLKAIGAENKQGNINKEECVSIIKRLSLKSFEGRYKILIIWLPEYLQKEGNRLLKMIEEPPENTLFVLVAENQELILNTILSRCQMIKVNALTDEDIKTALQTKEGKSAEEAEMMTYLADGNYNTALSLKEEKENDHAAVFLDWMRKCYQGNGVAMVKWVDAIATIGRERQKHFLQYALHFMREYMIMKITGNTKMRLRTEESVAAQKLAKIIAFEQIKEITELFDKCSYYIERNANPKVLFLDASIQMHRLLKAKPLVS
ncbi:MAG: ATP-binding protein [Saprospiraceae bacterium]